MISLKEYLTEMPRLIPNLPSAYDFGLRNINKARYAEFLSLPKEEYYKYDSNRIVYSSDNKFFCLDYLRKEVTYYMQYDVSYNKTLGSFLRQSLVWRSKYVDYNNTLPHEIFFNTLLPKYGTIATDGDQTDDGRRFWSYQIKYAFDKNLNVYYYNLATKGLIPIDNMMTFEEIKQKYKIWGADKSRQKQLIVITNKKLTEGQS